MGPAVPLKQRVKDAGGLLRVPLFDSDKRCAEHALSMQGVPAIGHSLERCYTSDRGLLAPWASPRQVPGASRRPTATLHANEDALSFDVLRGSNDVAMRVRHDGSELEVGARTFLGSLAIYAFERHRTLETQSAQISCSSGHPLMAPAGLPRSTSRFGMAASRPLVPLAGRPKSHHSTEHSAHHFQLGVLPKQLLGGAGPQLLVHALRCDGVRIGGSVASNEPFVMIVTGIGEISVRLDLDVISKLVPARGLSSTSASAVELAMPSSPVERRLCSPHYCKAVPIEPGRAGEHLHCSKAATMFGSLRRLWQLRPHSALAVRRGRSFTVDLDDSKARRCESWVSAAHATPVIEDVSAHLPSLAIQYLNAIPPETLPRFCGRQWDVGESLWRSRHCVAAALPRQ